MIVMSDMDDVFLPLPEDLLVTLEMARDAIVCLLERLPNMFKNTHVTGNALGTALQAASKLVVSVDTLCTGPIWLHL
jgi:protein transport protein SEC24